MSLSHRYSPYLGRYVLNTNSKVEPLITAQRSLGATPLVADGIIEAYSFPETAEAGVGKPWSAKVHNIGDTGKLGFGIGNPDGNPGNIVVTREGKVFPIIPGKIHIISTVAEVLNCTRIDPSGTIAFSAKGNYTLLLRGMHLDGTTWWYDQEIQIPVTVNGVTPPEWPVTEPVHVFDRFLMKCPPFKITNQETRAFTIYDLENVLGGRIRYSITWTAGGSVPPPEAKIYVDDIEYVSTPLQRNIPFTGETDLLSVGGTLRVKIQAEHTILSTDEVIFDVWADIGYTEEPSTPPTEKFDWEAWIEKNKYWIALGVVGGSLIIMYRPGRPAYPPTPIVVYPPPQPTRTEEPRRER